MYIYASLNLSLLHYITLLSLFVCWQHDAKNTRRIFTKFGGKEARDPRKKQLDVCDNPDYVTLGVRGLWLRFR